jgi:hypothetical protein
MRCIRDPIFPRIYLLSGRAPQLEKWCKRAIWGNTLPEIKHVWKTVDNLTSGAFVKMWQQRVDRYYTRYSETATN